MIGRSARTSAALVVVMSAAVAVSGAPGVFPLTRAERSGFTETSRYEEVMAFLDTLQMLSPQLRVEVMAISSEGRAVPLVIAGKAAPLAPAQAWLEELPVVFIMANIHAGEVEGKEASLMLLRDMVRGQLGGLLEHQVVLIAPIYNPDGNERISPDNRRGQRGPAGGVGVRPNGQNLDLNRDFVKLESPENQGLVKNVLQRWDPVLLVDCHTTNGSPHRHPVTYAVPHNPNTHPELVRYLRQEMLPEVTRRLKQVHGYDSVPYGNFVDAQDPQKGWETFGSEARYGTNYIGLRNRFAILDENYAYADFATRVRSCYAFLEAILWYTRVHGRQMRNLVRMVDRATVARALVPDSARCFVTRCQLEALPDPVELLSYEFVRVTDEQGRTFSRPAERPHTYRLPYFGQYVPTATVPLPAAYLFPAQVREVAAKLVQHGVVVERLAQPCTLVVDAFQVEKIEVAPRSYQGHYLVTLTGSWQRERKVFAAGDFFVDTAQPLAPLVACLLEPESDDALAKWNFFDRYLYTSQWAARPGTFPVSKAVERPRLARRIWQPEAGL
ncbi:MAG: M14 family metallopeptidase [Candidatus Oleimicrobiaceae bacterium]